MLAFLDRLVDAEGIELAAERMALRDVGTLADAYREERDRRKRRARGGAAGG